MSREPVYCSECGEEITDRQHIVYVQATGAVRHTPEAHREMRPLVHSGETTYHEGAGYNAVCACGFGRWSDSKTEADAQLASHIERNNRG